MIMTELPILDEESLQQIYTWIDDIPLSRPKKNITRDFSDGGNKIFQICLISFSLCVISFIIKFCILKMYYCAVFTIILFPFFESSVGI